MEITAETPDDVIELVTICEELVECLDEAHQSQRELASCHGGDSDEDGPDPDNCSYCRIIADAREALGHDVEAEAPQTT